MNVEQISHKIKTTIYCNALNKSQYIVAKYLYIILEFNLGMIESCSPAAHEHVLKREFQLLYSKRRSI